MVFQHAVFLAEVAGAKGAVADDTLGELFAVFHGAADFLGHCRGCFGNLDWEVGQVSG